jgi:hypothetical protein
MGTRWADGGYSSDVEIYLCAGGERLRVAQVGPSQLLLRDRRDICPGTSAIILICIDGQEEEHHVILDEGCVVASDIVHFSEDLVPF